MLQRWWFRLYILALVTVAIAIIVPMLPIPKSTAHSPVALPIESLGFYSNSVPLESRLHVTSWLSKNDVKDQSAKNITARQGSLRDTTYRLGSQVQRNVLIVMDIKQPAASFVIIIGIDPANDVSPLTSISCVEDDPMATKTKCQEMLRV